MRVEKLEVKGSDRRKGNKNENPERLKVEKTKCPPGVRSSFRGGAGPVLPGPVLPGPVLPGLV